MCGKITSSFCAARYGVHVGPLQVGRLAEALFGASQTAAVKTGKAGSSCWKMHSAQTVTSGPDNQHFL